jgi:hypothetical protein
MEMTLSHIRLELDLLTRLIGDVVKVIKPPPRIA